MIDTACYHCSASEHQPYAEENGFSLVKCNGCGLLYVTPRPSQEEIDNAHTMGVHAGDVQVDMTGIWSNGKVRKYVPILHDLFDDQLAQRDRSWLDIGCGHGELLKSLELASQGRVVALGVEPNQRKQASARQHGCNVNYFDLAEHDQKYDVVSLLNVYSHLPSPPEFIELCAGLLNPGGELVLETGDTADLAADDHPRPLHLPDHLSFASEAIVRGVIESAGFEVLRVCRYPAYSFGPKRYAKEIVKLFLPGMVSQLGDIASQRRLVAQKKSDMYVRARLR